MMSTRAHPSFTIAETEYRHGDTAVVVEPEKHTLAIAKREFKALPAYKRCEPINRFVKLNYPRPPSRDAKHDKVQSLCTVYLDYGGSGLPMHTVLREEHKMFMICLLGNPHSANPR